MNFNRILAAVVVCSAALMCPDRSHAQQPPASAQPAPPAPERDPDQNLDALQPDFTISTLPTTLRLPRFKGAFRVTHRFGRDRKSTRLNSSHQSTSRMPSSA